MLLIAGSGTSSSAEERFLLLKVYVQCRNTAYCHMLIFMSSMMTAFVVLQMQAIKLNKQRQV